MDEDKAKVSRFSSEKKWALVCYIPIFNIVTCVLASVRMVGSKFCLFHARQGLVLFGLWFLTILVALVSQVLSLMLWGVVLLLHISGIVIVYAMKTTQIPVIGQIAMMIPKYHLFTLLTGKIPEKSITGDDVSQADQPETRKEEDDGNGPKAGDGSTNK